MSGVLVDLVVNVFERSYRDVLVPGWFDALVEQNARDFAQRVVLLNNIDDMTEAVRLADAMVRSGEITNFVVVEEALSAALARLGLRRRHLEPVTHFTDWAMVAVTLQGSDFAVY